MSINYPTFFDPETTFVTFYVMPDGATVSHGGQNAPPLVPAGATELTREEYEAAQVTWQEAREAHRQAALLADQEALEAARAAALGHFRALLEHMPGLPVETARLLSTYDGPWPVIE